MILRRPGVVVYAPFNDAANPFVNRYRVSGGSDGVNNFSTGGATFRVAGPKGTDFAAALPGDGDVEMGTNTSFQNLGNVFGGEMWFRRRRYNGSGDGSPSNGEEWLVMNWNGGGDPTGKWLLAIDWASGRIYFRDPMGNTVAHTSVTVNDKNWHHIAWGKNAGANVIFLDGVDVSVDDSPTFTMVSGSSIRVGGDWNPRNFYGDFAKLVYYDRMPTQAWVNESRAFPTG